MTSASRAAFAVAAASYGRIRGANDVIGIGVIGLGNISRGHLAAFTANANSRVAAVCDIYAPRLDAGVTRTGARGYRRYEDLLADKDVDAVIICTPDHWHAPMAIAAMQAGKDVDVEKPMSLTIDEARRMVRTAHETQRILAVDSEHMAHGIWEPARKLVERRSAGKAALEPDKPQQEFAGAAVELSDRRGRKSGKSRLGSVSRKRAENAVL